MKPSVSNTAVAKHVPAHSLLSIVALILAGVSPVAWPQVTQPSFDTDAVNTVADNAIATGTLPTGPSNAARPRNTYGEIVRPTVKRKAGKTELYQPIKKQDDDGQIPEIEMFVGESRVFPTPNVARIAVGNGQIMSAAALDDKETIIFANGIGTSSLFIWNADGRYQRVKVNIVPGDTTRVAREVAAFLSTIPQAKASIVGDKVIVEGDTLSDEDREKIADLAKRYPQIVNFTSPIGWEKMVMMDVKVVEFPKTELREMGLKWTAAGGVTIGSIWAPINQGTNNSGFGYVTRIPTNGTELPIGAVDQNGQPLTSIPLPSSLNVLGALNLGLQARLNLLEQNGKASILAEPQLSARSGVKASFLAGGEIPYSVVTLQGVNVQFKQYGIKLDIEPRIGKNGVIRAVVDSEVSSIDQSVSTAAGPALLTRRTKTEFNAQNGETIVLAGLLQRSVSDDIDKVPFLGNIPVLGALFRSKRYQNKETELVVFVTPTIIDAKSPGLVDRVARTTERLSERLDKSPYLSDPLQPGVDADKPGHSVAPAQPANPSAPAPVQGGTPLPAAAPVPLGHVTPSVPAGGNPLQGEQHSQARGGVSLQVLREGLVLRAAPSDSAAALLELGYGSVVQLGDRNPPPGSSRVWRNVVVGAVSGWVHADGVTLSRGQPLLRSSGTSPVASKAVSGKLLTLGDKPGVAAAGAAKPVTAASPAQAAERYRVVLNGLALHVSPDVNSMVVTKLRGGDEVLAANQAPSGSWVAVQSGEARGWVAAQWLQPLAQ